MGLFHDFDVHHDFISKHVHAETSHVADATAAASTVADHSEDVAAFDSAVAVKATSPFSTSSAFKLPQGSAFDFGNVQPHVVEQSCPGFSTVTSTWNHDSSTQTGAGSQGWSSSSASADASPKPASTTAA